MIVEGGEKTLNSLIKEGYWDEAQIFITPKLLNDGVKAPLISGEILSESIIDGSRLTIYQHKS